MRLLQRAAQAIGSYLHTRDQHATPEKQMFIERRDRRRSTRVELEAQLTAETEDGHRMSGFLRDLSAEGTAALIFGDLNIGDRIHLAVHDPQRARPTVLEAVVRQHYGQRYGLKFCEGNQQEVTDFLIASCRTCVV